MSTVKRKRSEENNADDTPDKESDKWSEELHRCFVEAIYDAGMSQSSPSVIMENMIERPASLTSERVKSHLQKYRKNKKKSKEDFLQEYDAFLRKALTVGGAAGSASNDMMTASAVIEMMGGQWPSGGETAAFLSYAVMADLEETQQNNPAGAKISAAKTTKDCQDYLKTFVGTNLSFPQLTEEEKRSPLGISIVYVMGLFASLSQHTLHERRKKLKTGDDKDSNHQDSSSIPNDSIAAATKSTTNQTQKTFAHQARNLLDNVQLSDQHTDNSGNQRAQGSAGDIASHHDGGDFPPLNPGPPPHIGLFHPVLARPDLMEKKNGSTNHIWKPAMHPAPIPMLAFDEPQQKPSRRNERSDSPNSQHKGPKAPV